LKFSGNTLAYFQKRGENVNSASYCDLLLKLRDAICSKRPGQMAKGGTASSCNFRPHTAQATQERIEELQRELLEHPAYSLDLAPSDFHLFGPLENHLGVKRFADDKDDEMEVQKWLREQSKTSMLWVLMHW
jgi:histone-lysine N-methyltransferase SETMAR